MLPADAGRDVITSGSSVHYTDVIMGAIASQITSLTIVYSAVYSDADQRKHQSSASLAFVWWIHRGPVNSPHKWPATRKMFPFDDVIVWTANIILKNYPFVLVLFSTCLFHPYLRGLLHWQWDDCPSASEAIRNCMGKSCQISWRVSIWWLYRSTLVE